MAAVLMVDDDVDLAESTCEYLRLCGVDATALHDPRQAIESIALEPPSLVLLDVTMPGMSGFDVCRQVREVSQVPIIFLTARGSESEEILALNLGGDDFIRKPFSPAVLLAKVRRVLERGQVDAPAHVRGYADDHLRIDVEAERVWVDGEEVTIPATEFRLLTVLVASRGKVVAKSALLDEVWGSYVTEGTLSVHIRRLRVRIEPDPEHPIYLRTVWGRGFLFEAPDR